ncbi:hypothetical protein AHF37_00070, partial [Paragonimus kellicotti]
RKPNVPYSCKTRRRPCLDLSPLDNASVAFSEQTDVTFLVYTGNLRRAHSFRDIYVPAGILPPVKTVLIRERERTGSPPGRFHLTDDEFDEVDANIKHLARLYSERQHFEFGKRHLALMRHFSPDSNSPFFLVAGRKPNVPYSCKTRRRPCLDLSPLDNASVAFSEQTDVTFLVYTGNLRRAHSFRDIYVPAGILPPVKTVLIRERERTGSPPGRFHLTDDEFDEVDANIKHLARLYSERQHFEFGKRHLALMRTHYK